MQLRRLGLLSTLALIAASSAAAQELTVDEIRANLQAQIRESERSRSQEGAPVRRGIKVNNGTGDCIGDLYARPPAPPSGPPTAAAPPLSFTVEFALNSSQITPDSFRKIYRVAQALQDPELAGHGWMVIGHTDASGAPTTNLQLSNRRAQAVVDTLKQLDAPASQLFALGRGEEELLPGIPPTAPAHRRVQIVAIDR